MKVCIIEVSSAVGGLLAIGRHLELHQGSTPIVNAVQANIRDGPPGSARRGPGDKD